MAGERKRKDRKDKRKKGGNKKLREERKDCSFRKRSAVNYKGGDWFEEVSIYFFVGAFCDNSF